MSSTTSPESENGADRSSPATTPPSSPPPGAMSDKDYDPISERVAEEEKKLKAQARQEAAEDRKRSQEWSQAGKSEQKGQFNKLLHLVEKSKV